MQVSTKVAISTAIPGTSVGLKTTLRVTDMASARLRSTSFEMTLDSSRRSMVHALGVVYSVRKVKYLRIFDRSCVCEERETHSLPIFSIWDQNRNLFYRKPAKVGTVL